MGELAEILADPETHAKFDQLDDEYKAAWVWRATWLSKAHNYQTVPLGDWWTIWLLLAGRGAGKTRTAAEQIGWWAWSEPNTRWLVGAPTSSDVRATCMEGESGLLNVIPEILIADYNRAFSEIKLTNGSIIKGIPASEPERFRGPQFHGAWLDELAAWDYLQEAWDQVMFSVRLGEKTRIVATTTPRPKDLIVELVGREGDDVVMTTASTYQNLANLSPTFQKQILQYEGTKIGRQEIYAEILDPEDSGIVKREMFKLWPSGKAYPKFEYIVQSYDCASTEKTANDPTACITFGVFKPLDHPMSVMVIDCWQDRMQYPDLRPKVIEEYDTVYGEGKDKKRVDLILIEDKSAGIALIQDLARAHLPVRAYNPGKADKVARLNIVSNIIARGRVWIPESDSRKGFVKDWAEPFVSQICSFPDTTHDDFVDACVDSSTQITMSDGSSKRIDKVIVGDMVKTPNGCKQVTAVHINGIKEVWNVQVGDKTVLATANHKIFTNRGWVRVDSLNQAVDNGYILKGDDSCLQKNSALWLRQLSSMVDVTTDTLKAATLRTRSILQGLAIVCIEMFGFNTMGRFQKGATSTTLMVTQPTMTSAILSASAVTNIGSTTAKRYPTATSLPNILPTLKEYAHKPLNGTNPRMEGSGTESMLKNHWQKLGASFGSMKSLKLFANGAAQQQLPKAQEKSFVAQPARTLNQSSALVRQAVNTHSMRLVYDLTVDDEHCYYANGILVHNCTQALRILRDMSFLEIDPPPRDDWDEDDFVDSGRAKRENPYAV